METRRRKKKKNEYENLWEKRDFRYALGYGLVGCFLSIYKIIEEDSKLKVMMLLLLLLHVRERDL